MRTFNVALATLTTAVVLTACTSDDVPEAAAEATSQLTPATTSTTEPTAAPSEPTSPTSEPPADKEPARPLSLLGLAERELNGGHLRVVNTVGDYGAYTRHEVRYRSGDLTISGVLHKPDGRGPFPAVVLAHGYIEPSIYVTGQGMSREFDYLARAGYVVLHTDYRGYAASDDGTALSRETRIGYAEDVLNAARALRGYPAVDPERIGIMGRSMGGGVTMNALVAKPGFVDAAVVYASVSSRYLDNFNRWTRPERPERANAILDTFGSPQQSPEFWRGVSARTYVNRITEPVLMHHGAIDDTCPIRWAHATYQAMRKAGVDARLQVYPGEGHTFYADWGLSIRRTVAFLDRNLKA